MKITDMPPIDSYQISLFMDKVNNHYGKDIESHPVL